MKAVLPHEMKKRKYKFLWGILRITQVIDIPEGEESFLQDFRELRVPK